MALGRARHGYWCGARTYPTRCQYCGEEVYYFSCGCGCRVFFDALGRPWPKHNCTEYAAAQRSTDPLEQGFVDLSGRLGGRALLDIADEDYVRRLPTPQTPRVMVHRTLRVDPRAGETVYELGYVRELIRGVDIYKKLGAPTDSVFGYHLLGQLAESRYSQMTMTTGDLSRQDSQSYTCFIADRELGRLGVKRGDLVWFSLRALALPGLAAVWLCKALELPGC